MKNDQECKANNQAGDHPAPKPPPVTPRLCLIVLGHRPILLPVCHRAKGNAETDCRDGATNASFYNKTLWVCQGLRQPIAHQTNNGVVILHALFTRLKLLPAKDFI
jgi:hypothetical protein